MTLDAAVAITPRVGILVAAGAVPLQPQVRLRASLVGAIVALFAFELAMCFH